MSGGDTDDARDRLEAALERGPVWVGPVEMGRLYHQPDAAGSIGADQVVMLAPTYAALLSALIG